MELETVIGLEIHVQIGTAQKIFSASSNGAFGMEPNVFINEVDMGLPGALPFLNPDTVEKALRAAVGFQSQIQHFCKFDRKHYFYPDLPMGYQISQFDKPLAFGGVVELPAEERGILSRKIHLTRMHLEHDAGKLTHNAGRTLCDYNRAGCPLIEIVTEPEIRSAEEAQIFAREVQKILRFLDVSDADMEKGMMRFDASISLRPKGETKLFARTEIKNLNSFQSLLKALKTEEAVQKELWESGNPQSQQKTVSWKQDTQAITVLRKKESAADYRYFTEPDIPPLSFSKERIAELEAERPELPIEKYNRYREKFGMTSLEALKLSEEKTINSFFEGLIAATEDAKKSAGILLSTILAYPDWEHSGIQEESVSEVIQLWNAGTISATGAKQVVQELLKNFAKKPTQIIAEMGLEQNSDMGEIEKLVEEILKKNPETVAKIQQSDASQAKRFSGFLVGQVMKSSQGKANPQIIQSVLDQKLKHL